MSAEKLDQLKELIMGQIVTIKTSRDYYDAKECAEYSLSVAEVMEILSRCPNDAKVVFSNDNGYTFGVVSNNTIKITNVK